MRKKINIGYFFKEGFSNIFLHRFMSTAAVTMLAACLVVIGSFALIIININKAIDKVGKQNQIVIFLQDYVDDATAANYGKTLLTLPNIDSAVFVSREEGLKRFSEEMGDSDLFTGYESQNPIRNSYEITVTDLNLMGKTVSLLQSQPQIAKVRASTETVKMFLKFRNVASGVAVTIIVILALVSIIIISNTIRLATFSRREEIGIMRMVGATNRFIRASFVLEGLIIGIAGALLAVLLLYLLYVYIIMPQMSGFQLIELMPFRQVWKQILIGCSAAGILSGVGVSSLTLKKYLRV